MLDEEKIEIIKKHIKVYPDFPKPGIIFQDVFSILTKPDIFQLLCDVMENYIKCIQPPVQCIVALESRGFLFGPLLALKLNVPFAPIRKRGKLPGKIRNVSYDLEYGQDVFEIQEESVRKDTNVLIVDDLLATGGSLGAACKLINELGATVVSCLVVIELTDLNGSKNVPVNVHSLIQC